MFGGWTHLHAFLWVASCGMPFHLTPAQAILSASRFESSLFEAGLAFLQPPCVQLRSDRASGSFGILYT